LNALSSNSLIAEAAQAMLISGLSSSSGSIFLEAIGRQADRKSDVIPSNQIANSHSHSTLSNRDSASTKRRLSSYVPPLPSSDSCSNNNCNGSYSSTVDNIPKLPDNDGSLPRTLPEIDNIFPQTSPPSACGSEKSYSSKRSSASSWLGPAPWYDERRPSILLKSKGVSSNVSNDKRINVIGTKSSKILSVAPTLEQPTGLSESQESVLLSDQEHVAKLKDIADQSNDDVENETDIINDLNKDSECDDYETGVKVEMEKDDLKPEELEQLKNDLQELEEALSLR
jgi:hypothetical protein